MLDLEGVRRAHRRDMAEAINRLALASDNEWRKQTPCCDWTVGDLAAHLAVGQGVKAEALRRMRAGTGEPPSPPEVGEDRDAVLGALKEHHAELEAELEGLTPDDLERPVPLRIGSPPLAMALQVFVSEAGVHAQDLQMAMTGQGILHPDVIEATTAVLPMILRPGAQPTGPVAYRLRSPNLDYALTWRDGQWTHEASDDACVIEADDNALLLFALGRIDADDPGLYITDSDAAGRFKEYFPGP